MLYMVLEHFKGGPAPVYRRFRDQGRLAPDGLRYVSSWVTADLQRCYQMMECDDPRLLQQWLNRWKDLVDLRGGPRRNLSRSRRHHRTSVVMLPNQPLQADDHLGRFAPSVARR